VHGFVWLKNALNAEEIDWNLLKADGVIPEEQPQKIDEFKQFWDKIITAMNPFPKEDKNTPLVGQHPCNLEWAGLANTKQELSDLLNWDQHHTKCALGYCQVKLKTPGQEEPQVCCRFDYSMECCRTAGIGHDSKTRVRVKPRRNDPQLNNYSTTINLTWRANIDIKPVMSKDAALKCVRTPSEFRETDLFYQLYHKIHDEDRAIGTGLS
jgi:hypothetical protein